jgi:hypothetical protein
MRLQEVRNSFNSEKPKYKVQCNFSALMTEALSSSETKITFYQTMQCHITYIHQRKSHESHSQVFYYSASAVVQEWLIAYKIVASIDG